MSQCNGLKFGKAFMHCHVRQSYNDHVCAAPAHGKGEEGSLYEADSWAAIGAFLFGPDPSRAVTPHPASARKKIKVCNLFDLNHCCPSLTHTYIVIMHMGILTCLRCFEFCHD